MLFTIHISDHWKYLNCGDVNNKRAGKSGFCIAEVEQHHKTTQMEWFLWMRGEPKRNGYVCQQDE